MDEDTSIRPPPSPPHFAASSCGFASMPRNESTVRKTSSKKQAQVPVKKAATKKGKSSTYNAYMNAKLTAIKKENPSLAHKEAFQKAMDAWKAEQKGKAPPA